jgi:hypothetical protein
MTGHGDLIYKQHSTAKKDRSEFILPPSGLKPMKVVDEEYASPGIQPFMKD